MIMIKKTLMAVAVTLPLGLLAGAQEKLSQRQEKFFNDVAEWANSLEIRNSVEDGTLLLEFDESSLYTVHFSAEYSDEGPYWLNVARISDYGKDLNAETFKNKYFPVIYYNSPFKAFSSEDRFSLVISGAFEDSDSFLKILPFYIDYMEALRSEIVSGDLQQASSSPEFDKLSSSMVKVQGGAFTMGRNNGIQTGNGVSDIPAHKVVLSFFWISKYEVTQALWEAVMGNNPSQIKGPQRPVENVSWTEVNEFISRLNAMTGCSYRLPTEAEWEYAAAGGMASNGYAFPGSNDCETVAWMQENAYDETHDVGTLAANELGLYDMGGNVSEWCSDWLGSYTSLAENNPVGPASGTQKIYRGGNWLSDVEACRLTGRRGASVDSKSGTRGFRLAMDGQAAARNVKPSASSAPASQKSDSGKPETGSASGSSSTVSYDKVTVRPSFNGGTIVKFAQWVKSMAGEQSYTGDIVVTFTVGNYGNVSDVKILKGGEKDLNKKILNIIKYSPAWIPGKENGNIVPVRCRMTINFAK